MREIQIDIEDILMTYIALQGWEVLDITLDPIDPATMLMPFTVIHSEGFLTGILQEGEGPFAIPTILLTTREEALAGTTSIDSGLTSGIFQDYYSCEAELLMDTKENATIH